MTEMNFDIKYKNGPAISTNMRQALRKYINHHELHSECLRAILENNLKETVWHADDPTYDQVPVIVTFLHWEAPSDCHGSPELVKAWLEYEESSDA